MKVEGDRIMFHSGTIYYANKGIIGLDHNLQTYEGYDDYLEIESSTFSPEQKLELADYMINLWTKYKEKAVLLTLNKGETDAKQ